MPRSRHYDERCPFLSYLPAVNFLAHAYLSFNHPEILVGNMISDCVKGRSQYGFSENIQKGIQLHRMIDAYTDMHEATRSAKKIFQAHYRLYSAPITDIIYDHLLAGDDHIFSDHDLRLFAQNTYATLDQYQSILPPRFAAMLPYMKKDNWLYGYRTEAGIFRSLQGLMRRASLADDGSRACMLLQEHKAELNGYYQQLIGDVKQFAKAQFDTLCRG